MTPDKALPLVLAHLFPTVTDRSDAEHILSAYGEQDFHREPPRVKVAILKLAGSDLEKVRYYTEEACADFRDVLSWAEYPNQSGKRTLKKKDPEKYQALVNKGLAQYQAWLNSILKP